MNQVSTSLEFVEMVNHYEERIGELLDENLRLSEKIEELEEQIKLLKGLNNE